MFPVTDWRSGWLSDWLTNNSTTQAFYSPSVLPLVPVTRPIANDISGRGQFRFGLLKKPIGEDFTDMPHQGYQEPGIEEGVVYGGIFEEDSAAGCISLFPGRGRG